MLEFTRWSYAEDRRLLEFAASSKSLEEIALLMKRSPAAIHGYGPQSPCGFCNGPTSAEYQGDLLVELIDYLRDKRITRIEAQPEAEEAWRKLIADFWVSTLFPRAKSWYQGANVPGKVVESLNFPLGLPTYIAKFKESAANGYSGFKLN